MILFPGRRQSGFTLMEVMIAVSITSVIGLGVWQVMNGVIQSRDRVDEIAEEFDGLQRTMLLLERDLVQVVNRPARDIYGDYQLGFTSRNDGFALTLTRQGWRNPNPEGVMRSELQRVAWEYTGEEIRRRYWLVLDQGQDQADPRDLLLLEGVSDFSVRFLNENREWVDQWPPEETMAGLTMEGRPETSLPLGVEITVEHDRFGEVSRLFALPGFDQEQLQTEVRQFNAPPGSDSDEPTEPPAEGG